MAWVKPYLKNVQRLHMDQSKMETPDLLVAFETSMMEAEILARKPTKGGLSNSVILVNFLFRTRPEMSYQQEGYQRGPIHVGRVRMNFRAYTWTNEQIDLYKQYREKEDFKLMGLIDSSVKAAMDALGDELMRYLEEAGEEFGSERKEADKAKHEMSPYNTLFGSFKRMFSVPKKEKPKKEAKKKDDKFKIKLDKEEAKIYVFNSMWNTYHHFKKHHGMLNW